MCQIKANGCLAAALQMDMVDKLLLRPATVAPDAEGCVYPD